MKRILMLSLLIFCMPVLGLGAQIFGSLRDSNGAAVQGVTVVIQCNGVKDPYVDTTDAYGSYRVVRLPKSTRCDLSVNYAGVPSGKWQVYPDDDPVRYDFELHGPYNGALTLKRR